MSKPSPLPLLIYCCLHYESIAASVEEVIDVVGAALGIPVVALLVYSLQSEFFVTEFQQANEKESLHQPIPVFDCRWVRPCAPFVKLNVDGAINLRESFRGLGMVARNCNRELMVEASKRV
ncbi:PREDICTED: LOC18778457 isoform X3 [Prunus dulcis]|uniref:PREDICTED: LOC18778457 isoform X3 n=1 Tax=Prunus dulcis TaxID=3755 RepID=A0A5E4FJF1_PRUDU|nr:PREDICTED: LOC18778457 isoform X3 [Prunus dulcis]